MSNSIAAISQTGSYSINELTGGTCEIYHTNTHGRRLWVGTVPDRKSADKVVECLARVSK
jgi:hypothetical protein